MRILPVNNYQSKTNCSNQPNFESKMLRIKYSNGDEKAISGELLGEVCKDFVRNSCSGDTWVVRLFKIGETTDDGVIISKSFPPTKKKEAGRFNSTLVRKASEARHAPYTGPKDEVVLELK